ncbi:MAG TPA: M48 family metalloprotease [Pirellulales bacterium]|jgi:Zn-dependent protease with chaperone function|nr:M48 family metalloprotease [Pirellulales bacterium]
MNNKLVALAFVGVVVLLGAAWLVHYEAQQTREAMREIARDQIPQGVREGIHDSTAPISDRARKVDDSVDRMASTIEKLGTEAIGAVRDRAAGESSLPGAVADLASDVLGRMRDKATDAATGGRSLPSPGDAASVLGDVAGSTGGASGDRGNPNGDANKRSSGGLVDRVFDAATQVTKAGDNVGQKWLELSEAEERDWGRKLHEQVLADQKAIIDAKIQTRLVRLAAPILAKRKRTGIEYTFTALETKPDDINAFSLAGGYIYVHQGLLDFVKTDEELQFVLGHEIAHVDLRHCAKQLTYSARATQVANATAGNVVAVLNNLATRSFTKDQEYDADAYAFKAVRAAGQTADQALSFPRRFNQYLHDRQAQRGDQDTGSTSPAGTVFRRVHQHFETHPSQDDRLKRLEALAAQQSPLP